MYTLNSAIRNGNNCLIVQCVRYDVSLLDISTCITPSIFEMKSLGAGLRGTVNRVCVRRGESSTGVTGKYLFAIMRLLKHCIR